MITDGEVSAMNDAIAQAPSAEVAVGLIDGLTETMLALLLDLNHVDIDTHGLGEQGRNALGEAHGLHWVVTSHLGSQRYCRFCGHGGCE